MGSISVDGWGGGGGGGVGDDIPFWGVFKRKGEVILRRRGSNVLWRWEFSRDVLSDKINLV